MIYLDTSVALAHLLAEDRAPRDTLWREPLISSRLLQYEIWNRLNARRLGRSHGEAAKDRERATATATILHWMSAAAACLATVTA